MEFLVALKNKFRNLTVTGKIVASYLVIAAFSLTAIIYALGSLHLQNSTARVLVEEDARALALARELQAKLLRMEALEKQVLIVMKPETVDLIGEKFVQFNSSWDDFLPLLHTEEDLQLIATYEAYHEHGQKFLDLLASDAPLKEKETLYRQQFLPIHETLLLDIKEMRDRQQANIDHSLEQLSRQGNKAFRVTLVLVLLGLALATPVVLSVLINIHRSLRQLSNAAQKVATGEYDLDLDIPTYDEFGQVAREFREMGRKLREFEIQNLDANPLTHLPGNLVIQSRVEELLKQGVPFAHAFVDLDHFKAFNDRYGYQTGSDIISRVGDIIREIIAADGNEGDFVGHIGGDDYIFLTTPEKVEALSQEIIDQFDAAIPEYYSDEDRQAGFFMCKDRFGVERQFPLMTISIAIISSNTSQYDSAVAISHECAKMKEHLKRLPGSNYLIDRRKGAK